jgi:biopolymer transport protein ExbD
MKAFFICFALCLGGIHQGYSQRPDTAKSKVNTLQPYFIISAGTTINAFFNDKPLNISTIEEFNDYVQKNAKSMKESQVVVTGKPKYGTYDEVLKTLTRNRFKHITKNILKD